MNKFLIIPVIGEIEKSLCLAEKYGLGFEFNDFFHPSVLSNEKRLDEIIQRYLSFKLPDYLTLHGDFFDVTVFSEDDEIRRISELRINQSIAVARRLGAKSVVFHTNYNPFLKAQKYLERWLDLNEDFWSRLLSENEDINIYLENMFDDSPYLVARLSERLANFDNYGICYDYAHAALSPVPLDEWTAAVAPYAKHIHINDNDLGEDMHLAVGDGKIDWEVFAKALTGRLPNATVLIETSTLERQKRSIEFLTAKGLL